MSRFVKDRSYQWILEETLTANGYCDYEDLFNHISCYLSSDEMIPALEDYIESVLDMSIEDLENDIDDIDIDAYDLVLK